MNYVVLILQTQKFVFFPDGKIICFFYQSSLTPESIKDSMDMGVPMTIFNNSRIMTQRISAKFQKIWAFSALS